jgi:hypothetical protein
MEITFIAKSARMLVRLFAAMAVPRSIIKLVFRKVRHLEWHLIMMKTPGSVQTACHKTRVCHPVASALLVVNDEPPSASVASVVGRAGTTLSCHAKVVVGHTFTIHRAVSQKMRMKASMMMLLLYVPIVLPGK